MNRSGALGLGAVLVALGACSGSTNTNGFADPNAAAKDGSTGDNGGGSGSGGGGSGSGSGGLGNGSGGTDASVPLPDGSIVTKTTIYANTDDSLYSMDPVTKTVTLVGKFAGTSDASTDSSITDVAVDANGEVYVNSESVVYKAALPSSPGGTVQLTRVATISAAAGQRFYALAFAPAGVLGSGETLVGGDGNGELWSIDPSSGATKDLGSFGNDPSVTGNILALSGDLVFYLDAAQKPTGLATIRSCKPPTSAGKAPTCTKTNDYLAGVDMAALATAFNSNPPTPAKSLNGGIYGGSATSSGNGTGHGEVFGLGAWEGNVYGFSRNMTTPATPPALLAIDTTATGGAATTLPGSFGFSNGWSGAGVTTKVTINVPPPPPPPPPPK